MAAARRPLLTSTAAAALLAALWFVPSANATDEPAGTGQARERLAVTARTPASAPGLTGAEAGGEAGGGTGTAAGVDTTPYLIGGVTALGIGAAFARTSRGASAPLRG
ncbi:hypothetical protein ACFVWY_03100 [Streptomyces sp. NPDC058195]|uniref:hypothetical protein n=1 Tax=Streptomyces sp. NPDC058195 TaxID=3346375 RepID=UPI0036E55C5A